MDFSKIRQHAIELWNLDINDVARYFTASFQNNGIEKIYLKKMLLSNIDPRLVFFSWTHKQDFTQEYKDKRAAYWEYSKNYLSNLYSKQDIPVENLTLKHPSLNNEKSLNELLSLIKASVIPFFLKPELSIKEFLEFFKNNVYNDSKYRDFNDHVGGYQNPDYKKLDFYLNEKQVEFNNLLSSNLQDEDFIKKSSKLMCGLILLQPLNDNNKRMARCFQNYILFNNGYLPAIYNTVCFESFERSQRQSTLYNPIKNDTSEIEKLYYEDYIKTLAVFKPEIII